MRKFALFLAAVLTLNLAAPAAPVHAATQNMVTETEDAINEEPLQVTDETEAEGETAFISTESEETQEDDSSAEETTEAVEEEVRVQTEENPTEETTVSEAYSETIDTTETDETVTQTEEMTEDVLVETQEVIAENVQENTVNYYTATTGDITLALNKEVTIEVGIEDEARWLRYDVKKDGYYYFEGICDTRSVRAAIYVNSKTSGYKKYTYFLTSYTGMYIKAVQGDVLYLRIWPDTSSDVILKVSAREVEAVQAKADANGVYKATFGEYELITTLACGYASVACEYTLCAGGENASPDRYVIKHETNPTSGSVNLYKDNTGNYSGKWDAYVFKKNTVYDVGIILCDKEDVPIFHVEGVSVKTKDTDKPVVVTVQDITFNSATITYEKIVSGTLYAYYGKKGTTEKISFSKGTKTVKLEEATEYRFWIEDADGYLLYEENFKTKKVDFDISYAVTADSGTATLKASVSGYKGAASKFYFRYSYTDAEGEKVNKYSEFSLSEDSQTGGKKGTATVTINQLLAQTAYDFELALSEEYNGIKFGKKTKRVTTTAGDFTAKDVSFTVSQNKGTPTTIDYKVVIPKQEKDNKVSVLYGQSGDSRWYGEKTGFIYAGSTTLSGSITGAQEGQEYRIKLVLANQGISKTVEFIPGEVIYHPTVTADAAAWDADLSYTLPAVEADTNSKWTLNVKYKKKDWDTFSNMAGNIELNAANGYKTAFNSSSYTDFSPNTEYLLKWELYKDGKLCHNKYQSFTTKPVSAKVELVNIKSNEVNYKVTMLSKMDALDYAVNVTAKISDKNGQIVGTSIAKSFSWVYKENSYSHILPENNTEYTISLYYNDELICNPVTFKTTEDDRTLAINEIKANVTSLRFKVTLAGESLTNEENHIHLYARVKGETDWSLHSSSSEVLNKIYTISITSGIEENTTYEYVIGIGASINSMPDRLKAKNTGEVTTPEDDRELTVNKMEGHITTASARITCTGKMMTGTVYVLAYYRVKDSADAWERKYETMTAAGEQKFWFEGLNEDTEYEYIFGFGSGYNIARSELKGIKTGVFRTLKDDRKLKLESIDAYMNRVTAKVSVTGNTAGLGDQDVYICWREKNTDSWSRYNEPLTGPGVISVSSYSNLKEDTEYEYIIGISDDEVLYSVEGLKHIKSGEFRTITDDRSLEVTVEPANRTATFFVNILGKAADGMQGYVKVFYKEKGSGSEDYECFGYNGSGTYNLKVTDVNGYALKYDTEYEYVIGFANSYSDAKDKLMHSISGSFTTDSVRLENTSCEPGYENAYINTTIVNNTEGINLIVHCFIRPKGTEGWPEHMKAAPGNSNTMACKSFFSGLKQGTEYEYALVVSEKYGVESPDEVQSQKQKVTGSFITKENKYALHLVADDTKSTTSKGYIKVSATGDDNDENLYLSISITDGKEIFTEKVTLSRAKGYENTVAFTGLKADTRYTVTETALETDEWRYRVLLAKENSFAEEIGFTTKQPVVPQTLQLPVEELYLNVAGGGDYISQQNLNVKVTPVDADKEFLWESENNKVATVKDGFVKAVGEGTALITVSSVHNPEIKDTCTVVVKNYVIAKENASGQPQKVTGTVSAYKGDILSGYALYEADDAGMLAKVDGTEVSVERSPVAQWSTEGLKATGTGKSKVYFEANGVKAVMDIEVRAKAKGFGLVGLDSADSTYPAVCEEDGSYTIANKDGLTYTVVGEITPKLYFNSAAFEWSSSDENIATVVNGVITPVAEGTVTITACPFANPSPYVQSEASIVVNVKSVPQQEETIPTVYAVVNTREKMLLKDVAFPKQWGEGWTWRDPKTPLYTLPVHEDSYAFEAVYTGEDLYPYEGLVNVYISKIKKVYANEIQGNHNHAIEVAEEGKEGDSLILEITDEHMGRLPGNYRYVFLDVEGLTIEEADASGRYRITAQKAGKYTLQPVIEFYETNEEGEQRVTFVMLGQKYSLKATKTAQAAAIRVVSKAEDVQITGDNSQTIRLDFTEEMKGKKFTLLAEVEDKNGNSLDTALQWKTSDKTVATVSYKKNKSHTAEITVKGSGHAIISVKACDDAAYTAQLGVEFLDYAPRINTAKAKVNLACDYTSRYGAEVAYNTYGFIEIIEAYGEKIQYVKLTDRSGEAQRNLKLSQYSSYSNGTLQYIVIPSTQVIDTGVYDYALEVMTYNSKEPYRYPLKVTVVNEAPKVSAKMEEKMNLFYRNGTGVISFDIEGADTNIQSIVWEDKASDANGFEVSSSVEWNSNIGKYCAYVSPVMISVVDGKPADSKIAAGTLKVIVNGFMEAIEINNFKMEYSYEKPKLEARKATTSIAPVTGDNTAEFAIYDKLNKSYLYYNTDEGCMESYVFYSFSYENENVEAIPITDHVKVEYSGTKEKETVTYTLDSYAWREPLTVKQTIKVVAPKASLTSAVITYNKAYTSKVSTFVYLGNVSAYVIPQWIDLEVKGTNAKAKALVENGIFEITCPSFVDKPIQIELNKTSLMNLDETSDLKSGTYKFKVTPYYRDQDTGNKIKLNTMNLSIKVVDKPVTVKVTPKGSLDIAKVSGGSLGLLLKSDFKNLGQDYVVTDAKLKGEYSKYFKVVRENVFNQSPENYYSLQLSELGKVQAGRKYKLTVEYTVMTTDGKTFKVQSNVFTIKPKQSAPKVSVQKNNQVLYAYADMSQSYYIEVPQDYIMQDVNGSLDCNKDGRADVILHSKNINGNHASFEVRLANRNAVVATKAGKTYTIPVTVTLKGRDGISKDAKVNIKVKVKR